MSDSEEDLDQEIPDLNDPAAWPALLEAAGPESLLVLIDHKLGPNLSSLIQCEDILQEAYIQAWTSRHAFQWRGARSFRAWIRKIVDHRIYDESARLGAAKRGNNRTQVASSLEASGVAFDPSSSTTPSRAPQQRETAEAMRSALLSLPADIQPVVFGRVFEEKSLGEIAAALGIGLSAAKHRFRRGAELYRTALHHALRNSRSSQDT